MQDSSKIAPTKRILIIEDDPVHRRLIESTLQHRYELDSAADSESALARLRGGQPPAYALVIVDLRVPARIGEPAKTEEGFKILQALQGKWENRPVIVVVSGNMVDRTRERVEALGAKRVFGKPFSLIELRECIDSLLNAPKSEVETDSGMANLRHYRDPVPMPAC